MTTVLKTIVLFLIIQCFLSLASCRTNEEKYYYSEELIHKIKKIKRNKDYTYLSYQLPEPEMMKVREYRDKKIQYRYKAKKFRNNEAIFALVGRSTMNHATLDRIEGEQQIRLDSTTCRHSEFLFLKLHPVTKGTYKIKGWGCRYGKEFEIILE